MAPPSKGVIAAWLLGGVTILTLVAMFFRGWFSGPKVPLLKDAPARDLKLHEENDSMGGKDEGEEEEEEEDDNDVEEEEAEEEVEVEDASDDEAPVSAPSRASQRDSDVPKSPTTPSASSSEEEEEAIARKARYEVLSKECTALISAQNFLAAADKLTELIALAGKVARGQQELVTLYNNRSAMYEKLRDFERCLRDIQVMLLMQPDHLRARARRARVYEAQEKWRDAANEYIVCNWIEQARQEKPTNESKVQPIFKKIGVLEAAAVYDKLKAQVSAEEAVWGSGSLPPLLSDAGMLSQQLPSTAYMTNVFEAFPNTALWLWALENTDTQTLRAALAESRKELEAGAAEGHAAVLRHSVQLAQVLFAREEVSDGFAVLRAAEDSARLVSQGLDSESADASLGLWAALFFELLGCEAAFRQSLIYALHCWHYALALYRRGAAPLSAATQTRTLSVRLRIAALYAELERPDAQTLFREMTEQAQSLGESGDLGAEDDSSSAQTPRVSVDPQEAVSVTLSYRPAVSGDEPLGLALSVPQPVHKLSQTQIPRVLKAWVVLHECARHTVRDAQGQYMAGGVERAVQALEDLVASLEGEMSLAGRTCVFIAQLKVFNVLTHIRASMEQAPSEAETEKCRATIQALKLLRPAHPTLLLLEAEQLAQEAEVSAAQRLLERARRRRAGQHAAKYSAASSAAEGDLSEGCSDVVMLVAQASVSSAEAFLCMQQGQLSEAQRLFMQVQRLYARALEHEPTAIEVHAQAAQLQAMVFGDFPQALQHVETAQALFRTRDELQDLRQMQATFAANARAIQMLQNPTLLAQ